MDRLSLEDEANKTLDDDDGFVELAKQESRDSLSLYDTEGQVLTLYDQLVELKLEKAIFEAQLELSSGAR